MLERVPIDHDRLLATFLRLLRIDSYHGDEDRIVEVLRPTLEAAGLTTKLDAHGNLIARWDEQGSDAQPLMLNAHMDTVWPTSGMEPVVTEEGVASDGSSVLGADDKAGVAAIVEGVQAVADAGLPHGLIELVFTVGEDVGHIGSRAFDPAAIESRRGLVFDGDGPVGSVVTEGPAAEAFTAVFRGRAAHAGTEPENGISAIAMMARAIDRMQLGRVSPYTVANIGTVNGGQAMNIVPAEVTLVGQARSLRQWLLDSQIAHMREVMEEAAKEFGGTVEYEETNRIQAFGFSDMNSVVKMADRAIRSAGLEPSHVWTGGGSDAHEFNAKGIWSTILGMGCTGAHTVDEFAPHAALRQIAQVAAQAIVVAG